MKIYNVYGNLIILCYVLACAYFAPPRLGPWVGILIGAIYFVFCWFLAGLYLADVLHMGIAHRALDYKEWFIKAVTIVNNTVGIYVDPIAWVNGTGCITRIRITTEIPTNLLATVFGTPCIAA